MSANTIVNLILATDSYKVSHFKFYPKGTNTVFSYIEPRAGGAYDYALVIGLQDFVVNYLSKPITREDIDYAEAILSKHMGSFNREGWEYIVDNFNGYMPVRIRGVREGTLVPINNALVTIENIGGAETAWVTSYLETALLRAVWYPTTVASKVFEIRQHLKQTLKTTSGDTAGLEYMLHDFGARGGTSGESVALASMAHQMMFEGTDTLEGLMRIYETYGEFATAGSIDATEHSIMTAKMREGEMDQFINVLDSTDGDNPDVIVACVADSYNIYKFCQQLARPDIKERILNRKGRLVIRPDSGVPEEIVVEVLLELENVFGATKNAQGFKVLNENIGVIQGDGLGNLKDFRRITAAVIANGFCMSNLAFGMGGGIHQKDDRDTMRWAMKCSARQGDDVDSPDGWMDIFKDPIHGSKTSKKGRMSLFANQNLDVGSMRTMNIDERGEPVGWFAYSNPLDVMVLWYEADANGVRYMRKESFRHVKERARSNDLV